MPEESTKSEADLRDYRLKQLEFLLKFMDSETVGLTRLTQLLIFANGAAIGVIFVLLKDLKGMLNDQVLIRSLLTFVFGILFGGLSQAATIVNVGIIRSEILELLFNGSKIDEIRGLIGRLGGFWFVATPTVLSLICFLVGVLYIIWQI
jgi:hypothetical protein